MKLYATVTSERATKGQGGEYLDIEIKNEMKIVFATIKVRGQVLEIWHDNETEIRTHKDSAWNKEIYEYQKGETSTDSYSCEECGDYGPVNIKTGVCSKH